MNARAVLLAVAIIASASGCDGAQSGSTSASSTAPAPRPDYQSDVYPILAKHCLECHVTGGISNRPLDSYARAVTQAAHIRSAVTHGDMPPWGVDDSGECGSWEPGRRLSKEELTTLVAWIDNGGPEGVRVNTPGTLPQSRLESNAPALSVRFGDAYVARPGDAAQRCFVVDSGLSRDEFLTGLSLRRDLGLRQVTLYAATPDVEQRARELSGRDGSPGFACAGGRVLDTPPLLGVTSVDPQTRLPAGTGLKLVVGQKLIVQAQYDVFSSMCESCEIGLELATSARPARWIEVRASTILLPPNDRNAGAEATGIVDQSVQVLGIYPLMRRLGTSLRLTLDRPAGKGRVCMMSQSNWNYSLLRRPRIYSGALDVEAGALASLTCRYNTLGRSAPVTNGDAPDQEECGALLYVVNKD